MSGTVGRRAVATIASKNYLSFARVLARSFREHHPEIPLFLLLADEVDGHFVPAAEPFRLLGLGDLAIPHLQRFRFRYSREQVAVAAKPFLFAHLLDQGFGSVIYLDADVLVLGDLTPLFARLGDHSIVLTPHLLAALTGAGRVARELDILCAGVYNLGFLGVSDTPTSREFLAWWQDRLYSHCRLAHAEGLHLDQRWIDLVPGLFDNVHILRDPGCNVGHWNLPERNLQVQGDAIRVDGQPLRFFHFSGWSPDQPLTVSKHSRRLAMKDLGPAIALFERYLRALVAAGYDETKHWPYAYARFDNGKIIPDIARAMYLDLELGADSEGVDPFGDPFAAASAQSFFHFLNQPIDQPSRASMPITRLWHAIYRQRPDVQRAFPDSLGADREAFLAWTRQFGVAEYAIPEAFQVQFSPAGAPAGPEPPGRRRQCRLARL